jgi:hypothetical protein
VRTLPPLAISYCRTRRNCSRVFASIATDLAHRLAAPQDAPRRVSVSARTVAMVHSSAYSPLHPYCASDRAETTSEPLVVSISSNLDILASLL